MLPEDGKLQQILEDGGYVKSRHMKKALEYSYESGRSFLEYLFDHGKLTKQDLGTAMSDQFDIKYANLIDNPPDEETIKKLPREVAEDYHCIMVKFTKKKVIIASDTPDEKRLVSKLKELFPSKDIYLRYELPEVIAENLKAYRTILDTNFPEIANQRDVEVPIWFDTMIADAVKLNASDLHVEPKVDHALVRFRVDGQLEEAGMIPKDKYESLLNFLKVKNNMRTDIKMQPQDGSMQYRQGRKLYDIRTNIAPTIDGEKIVMRLLSAYVRVLSLSELGLSEKYQGILEKAIKKPYGMVVVSGPTGSGKTTTLYALLKSLNRTSVNVTTIEDPVEYRTPGVNQIQVNREAGLTFAKGLRALVRQDPNVILLGEIRDSETAEIALNAALTGILIFTTFHAGDSAITIPRLVDMGIEPFILASAMELIMSQRLLRKICENCKVEYEVDRDDLEKFVVKPERFFKNKKVKLFKGEGCEQCDNTGFNGRVAIFESISMTAEMRDLTVQKPSALDVWKLAKEQGSMSLFEDGMLKVDFGITTFEELVRVAQPWEI